MPGYGIGALLASENEQKTLRPLQTPVHEDVAPGHREAFLSSNLHLRRWLEVGGPPRAGCGVCRPGRKAATTVPPLHCFSRVCSAGRCPAPDADGRGPAPAVFGSVGRSGIGLVCLISKKMALASQIFCSVHFCSCDAYSLPFFCRPDVSFFFFSGFFKWRLRSLIWDLAFHVT